MVGVPYRLHIPPVRVRLVAVGTRLFAESFQVVGHASEPLGRHARELAGQFQVDLVVELDGARVLESLRPAPRAEGRVVGKTRDAGREAVLSVGRVEPRMAGGAVVVADASEW